MSDSSSLRQFSLPTAVLLPGFSAASKYWSFIIKALQARTGLGILRAEPPQWTAPAMALLEQETKTFMSAYLSPDNAGHGHFSK